MLRYLTSKQEVEEQAEDQAVAAAALVVDLAVVVEMD